MDKKTAYKEFTQRLKVLFRKNPHLITTTLSNIFTMRLVGNKTHGDLAEIAIAEFINQYMYDYISIHVGKDLFRAKQSEEDIQIINEITEEKFSVSLKAYGDGPLQMSTDKRSLMFSMLQTKGDSITDREAILEIMSNPVFDDFANINVLPLIYDEKKSKCNIMVFDYDRAKTRIARIVCMKEGQGRKHPVYRFFDHDGDYVCEVRYGGATANALQRGLWTHTRNGSKYFDSLTDGWIDYSPYPNLVRFFAYALLSTPNGHAAAFTELQRDVEAQKQQSSGQIGSLTRMHTFGQQSLPLFENEQLAIPETEGIKYAGSKLKLLPQILQLAQKVKPRTVFDGFSGTTRVAQAFAQVGYQVVSNDIACWSKEFGTCYLLNSHPRERYRELLAHLNALPGKDGWFTEHYGGDTATPSSATTDNLKKPWQRHNTRKLDAIREEIERLELSQCERAVALTSLIMALDAVDSTLGHFASYLKEWSPRSYNSMTLKIPHLIPKQADHKVHQLDIFECLPTVQADLAYYDPPYGSNNDKMPPSRVRYGAYYHLWTSVCLFDKPDLFGKAKRRVDSSDVVGASIFEEFRRSQTGRFVVVEAIERLLQQTSIPYIILSYSSGGRATAEELHEVITSAGKILEVLEVDHKRNVMGKMRWTEEWVRDAEGPHREFLFLIEK